MQQAEEHRQPSVVLLIDELHLRRAAIGALLQPWAEEVGAILLEGDLGDVATSQPDWAMVILSLGGTHIMQGSSEIELRHLVSTAGNVPVVVVSDREDATEMIKAFEAGIRGFLPTSTSTDVALKALTFILRGGHFFPPSVLKPSPERRWPKVSPKGPNQSNDPDIELRNTIRVEMRRPSERGIGRPTYRIGRPTYGTVRIVARLRRLSPPCQAAGRRLIRLTVSIRSARREQPGQAQACPAALRAFQVSRMPRLKAAMNGSSI